jgi:hypothetical protein
MYAFRTLLCAAALSLTGVALAEDVPGQGADLFSPIASVLQSPRCINCHPVTQFPHQGDEHRRHDQMVMRGPDNHGHPALHCNACHQTENEANGYVPGAPNWHLAPLSMAWEGLSAGQICHSIKDPAKNGNRRTLDKVVEHMRSDPLVLWAWNPGNGRTLPPIPHEQFVQDLDAWVAAGGPCPS